MKRVYCVPLTEPPVPLPTGEPWPAEGREVPFNDYVRRRIADQDIVEAVVKSDAPAPVEAVTDSPPAGDAETVTEEGAEKRRTRTR